MLQVLHLANLLHLGRTDVTFTLYVCVTFKGLTDMSHSPSEQLTSTRSRICGKFDYALLITF